MIISFIDPRKAQDVIAEKLRTRRLELDLSQEGLSARSGVPLATLRKFEQRGTISLVSFLKLLMALGMLDSLLQGLEAPKSEFSSIDEVIKHSSAPRRQRGRGK